jgi:hypothetical protein
MPAIVAVAMMVPVVEIVGMLVAITAKKPSKLLKDDRQASLGQITNRIRLTS